MTRETVDLSNLAEGVMAELRQREPTRRVEFHAQSGLTADCDPRLMRIVFENLLGNAWKFTSKKLDAVIEFRMSQYNGGLAFVVQDNGAGFDSKYLNNLFTAFQRLHSDREFPGTGIGLATVRRVVQRHGGETWADAKVDCGAAFYFTLPEKGSTA